MCWNWQTSALAMTVDMTIGFFLMFSRRSGRRDHVKGVFLLGLGGVQLAEALIHWGQETSSFPPGTCRLHGLNEFGTQVVLPIAFILQSCSVLISRLVFGARRSSWKQALYDLCVPSLSTIFWLQELFVYLSWRTSGSGAWPEAARGQPRCSWLSPSGYLIWKHFKAHNLIFHLLTVAFSFYSILNAQALLQFVLYNLTALYLSLAFTDAPSSNWCLYGTGLSVLALLHHGKAREAVS